MQKHQGKMSMSKNKTNTLRPRQNSRHFTDDILACIFLNENVWIPIRISLKFVPKSPMNNIPALVQIMAWRRPGDKLLSEPMLLDYRRIYASLCLNELKQKWQHLKDHVCIAYDLGHDADSEIDY